MNNTKQAAYCNVFFSWCTIGTPVAFSEPILRIQGIYHIVRQKNCCNATVKLLESGNYDIYI